MPITIKPQQNNQAKTGGISVSPQKGKPAFDVEKFVKKETPEKGFLGRVVDIFKKRISNSKEAIKGGDSSATGILERGTRAIAEPVRGIGDVIGDVAQKEVQAVQNVAETDTGKKVIEASKYVPGFNILHSFKDLFNTGKESVEKVGDSEKFAQVGEKINTWAEQNPEAYRNLENILKTTSNVGDVAGFIAGAGEGVNQGKKVFQQSKKVFSDAKNTTAKMFAKSEANVFDDSIKAAQRKMNPTNTYTPTESGELLGKNTKTEGKGIFKRDVPNEPVTGETEAVADMVRTGKLKPSNTPGEDIVAIDQEARVHDQNIDTYLQEPKRNVPFNQRELDGILDEVKQEAKTNRTFLSESQEERAFNDVIDIAKEEAKKNPYNMAGMRKSSKAFNKRMEEIFDKSIYKDADGVPNTISEARIDAAKKIRKKFADFTQKKINRADALQSVKNFVPKDAEFLVNTASRFSKKDDFIKYVKENFVEKAKPGAGVPGGTKMKKTKDFLRPDTDFVLRRNPQTGYKTTVDEDLGEIWDISHTEAPKGSAGDVFKQELQTEAQLLNARNTIKYRGRSTLGKNKIQIWAKRNPQKSRMIRQAATGAGLVGTGVILGGD